MDENETSQSKRPPWLIAAGFGVVILLILAGLFLPPISLGERLGLGGGDDTATVETAPITEDAAPLPTEEVVAAIPEGVALSVPGGEAVTVERLTVADLAASSDSAIASAVALPVGTALVGDVYLLRHDGAQAPSGQIAVPLPADAGPAETLDLFAWDGTEWAHAAGQIDATAQKAVLNEGPLPMALIVGQTAAPDAPTIGLALEPGAELSDGLRGTLSEVSAGVLLLGADGQLTGDVPAAGDGGTVLLEAGNRAAIVDQAAISALLGDVALQDTQIATLVEQAAANGYAGVNLDFQGIPAAQAEAFTDFATRLADALDAQGLDLAITLGTPTAAGTAWDTGGQEWAALGRVADILYLDLPLNPDAYGEGGLADQLLNWATDQVDRRKLNAVVSAGAITQVGESFNALDGEQVLATLGALVTGDGETAVDPAADVELKLDTTASPLEWDGNALAYRYTYEQNGQPQTIWFNSEASLLNRLQLAERYNLRGVTIDDVDDLTNEAGVAAVLNYLRGEGDAPQPSGAAIAWTVRDSSDSVVASETSEALSYVWTTPEGAGVFIVSADLVLGDLVKELGAIEMTVGTPEVAEEAAPAEEAAAEPAATPDTTAAEPQPAAPSSAVGEPGEALAVVNTPANVRVGPGITYGTIAGGASGGAVLKLIGRNEAGDWYNVVLPSGEEGWILNSLVTVNAGFNPSTLAVVEAAPPAAAAGAPAPAPSTAGGPPPVAPVGNVGNFELGGQAAGMPAGIMQYAGMTWVKKQHKWNPGDSPEAVAGMINEAHANGLKILLSIPGPLYPTSIDFQGYAAFLGGVAALGPDAIEVWNEMNIDREWPAGQIDPTSYVNNMLRPSYQAIKAANPNVMVITGAPAPTGFFGGCSGAGCDDAPYVAGMMAAGAGSVSDCVGVHYNEGLMPPSATSGDPRGAGGHYTRYFQGMINAYTAAGAGQLCFTELGYLSGEEWGSLPAGFLWKAPYNLTVAEHAQYLADAVRVGVQSGRVRMIIVFNVDFTTYGDDPQAGFAMIRPGGGCPACETLRSVMGQ
jgi:hypothetical protein